jgi:hypothetical protein
MVKIESVTEAKNIINFDLSKDHALKAYGDIVISYTYSRVWCVVEATVL